MLNLIQKLAVRLRTREEGQTFVEYGLVIGVVSIGLMLVFGGLAGALGGVVGSITDAISGASES